MTCDILAVAGQIKALLAESDGTPTQKLLAILIAAGVDKTPEQARLIGVGDRAIQLAKQAKHTSLKAKPASHSKAKHTSETKPASGPKANPASLDKEIPPTPPKEITTSLKLLTDSQELRATDRPTVQDDFVECKSAFNGSTEHMLQTVMAGMGGRADRKPAAQWLKTMLDINGQDAVQQAFQMLETARIKGDIITDPIRWWSKTAGTLKGKAKPAVENPFAAQTKGVVRHARPAAGSERMAGVLTRA